MADGLFGSYIALGDSFTEGMDDPRGDGTYRGWADLVAERLAQRVTDFRYANLAIRGRLLQPVIDEQVPAAVRMAPDLISFAAGGNDALRRRFDPEILARTYDDAIGRLVATGATVVVFTPADPTGHLPARSSLLPRCEALLATVRRVAAERGALLVDLWSDDVLRNRLMWSTDRLHLSTLGHRRVAAHVLDALGVAAEPAWSAAPPHAAPMRWAAARRDDVRWVRAHLAPWIGRRLRGRSSGDQVMPKRPELDRLVSSAHEAPSSGT
jgi:lysophospholipase L1-like esterase